MPRDGSCVSLGLGERHQMRKVLLRSEGSSAVLRKRQLTAAARKAGELVSRLPVMKRSRLLAEAMGPVAYQTTLAELQVEAQGASASRQAAPVPAEVVDGTTDPMAGSLRQAQARAMKVRREVVALWRPSASTEQVAKKRAEAKHAAIKRLGSKTQSRHGLPQPQPQLAKPVTAAAPASKSAFLSVSEWLEKLA